MAVTVICQRPRELLKKIYRAIDKDEIVTWSYDNAGDLTHSVDQWEDQAWMRPRVTDRGNLMVNIIAPQGDELSSEVYAVFHGRFIEMLLAHFDDDIEAARATAQPLPSDLL